VSRPSPGYEPRRPGESVLYQIVRDHFETFRVQAATLRDGEGLPRFATMCRSRRGSKTG
jgi:hypothetical protein